MSKLIVFDFDGTMVDSLGYYLDEAKRYFPHKKEFLTKKYVHKEGMKALIDNLPIPKILIPVMLVYIRLRHHHIIKKLPPHKGIKNVIEKLSKDQNIAIVSSNSKRTIKIFLENNKMDSLVDDVKSSPLLFKKDKVLESLAKKYPRKNDYIYIGDEQRDIEAAKNSGYKAVAVRWGFESANLLRKINPDFLAKDVDDILKYTNSLHINTK